MLYGKVDERTVVRLYRMALEDPRIEIMGDFDTDTQLVSLPRYQPTTDILVELARRGACGLTRWRATIGSWSPCLRTGPSPMPAW